MIEAFEQMRDHLGVGLCAEIHAFFLQKGLEFLIILDDTVMYHRDTARSARMRMRV